MNAIFKFGLLGQLMTHRMELSKERTPVMVQYLEDAGIGELNSDNLCRQLHGCLNIIERQFDYYDASELKVNELLDQYLIDVSNAIINADYAVPREIAMNITALGNKGGDFAETDGVKALLEIAQGIIEKYRGLTESDIPGFPPDHYRAHARQLEALDKVLSLVDVYVTAHLGMLAGVEEYAPVDYNYLHPVETTDWVSGIECNQQDDCTCGCVLDHPLRILTGFEDYLQGTESNDRAYFESVANTNGVKLAGITGNEAITLDAIESMGRTALEAVMAAWESIKKWLDEADDEEDKATVATAEDNKKAIQGMPSKAVRINDAARNGIKNLATKADPTGELTKIVTSLNGPGDASRVIDGLLGALRKHSKTSGPLKDQRKKTEDALGELRKRPQRKDGSPEALAAARTAMQAKIKTAREAVKDAKKLMSDHNKITKAIRRAITGITPHIFISEGGGGKEKDNKE